MAYPGNKGVWRNSVQEILPLRKKASGTNSYDIYPTVKLREQLIFSGFDLLAEKVSVYKNIIIECYSGVFIDHFTGILADLLRAKGYSVSVTETSSCFRPPEEIDAIAAPFLGNGDPLFGKKTSVQLEDLLDHNKFDSVRPRKKSDINIFAGPGASLAGWEGVLIYIDLPRNEIQYRARAGSILNLGTASPADPEIMYKRFYFFDWVILNRHKESLLPDINIFVDGQRPEMPVWVSGQTLRYSLRSVSRTPFRVRPWFEPGSWGGTWIRDRIEGLSKDTPNYAWSFELITPENGIILESSGLMMEFSFDFLMFQEARAVLGDCHKEYGNFFPLRFDFLDTFNGGNLSLQCHPRPEYIKKNFGEPFTQEETYYILDAKEDASVFLGFREDIDPDLFRADLENSFLRKEPVDEGKYVLSHPSKKHDFFLVPYGTIHGSGRNNLVLEISTTPYIFTFKLYDWLRPDLNGRLRNLNIARGFENLFFDRKGSYVNEKLISKPVLLEEGPGWKKFELPTHETHSYAVHRYHFTGEIKVRTAEKCLVLNLTEGKSIIVTDQAGAKQHFSYAETFIIPAAAGEVKILNDSDGECILVSAFIK